MATMRNLNTPPALAPVPPPLPGYRRLVIEISDRDIALLTAELEEQRAYGDSIEPGLPPLAWTIEKLAAVILEVELRQRFTLREHLICELRKHLTLRRQAAGEAVAELLAVKGGAQ